MQSQVCHRTCLQRQTERDFGLPSEHKQFQTEMNTVSPLGPGDLRTEKSVVDLSVSIPFIFATLVNCRVRIQARGTLCRLTMKQQRKQQNKHPHKRSLRKN